MPVENPTRNAELAMQNLCLSERDRGAHLRNNNEELRSSVELVRCLFSEPPFTLAPWGAITVPGLQEWYEQHGGSRTEKEATTDIRTTENMVLAPSEAYDVTRGGGVAPKPVRVYHPQWLSFCAGVLYRYYKMSEHTAHRIRERYRINPERVREIFNDPERFVESPAFDYDALAKRYPQENPLTGETHYSDPSTYHMRLFTRSDSLWESLTTELGPSDFL
jgi:hypothetical protein